MLKEASGYKTWLSEYLDETSECLHLPDPEMSTNRYAMNANYNFLSYTIPKKSWENESHSIRINIRSK